MNALVTFLRTRGVIFEEFLWVFLRSFWSYCWGTPGEISQLLLKELSMNPWRNSRGTSAGCSGELLEDLRKHFWKNSYLTKRDSLGTTAEIPRKLKHKMLRSFWKQAGLEGFLGELVGEKIDELQEKFPMIWWKYCRETAERTVEIFSGTHCRVLPRNSWRNLKSRISQLAGKLLQTPLKCFKELLEFLRNICRNSLENFGRNSRVTPGEISEEFPWNSEGILKELLEKWPRNSWRRFRDISGGISEELLAIFPGSFWRNSCRNSRWATGDILGQRMDKFLKNCW